MGAADRERWNRRYVAVNLEDIEPQAPAAFGELIELFPTAGRALDVACGRGAHSVWLAQRGLCVVGVDIAPLAVELAVALALRHDVGDQCRFELADLDLGLPQIDPVDLVLCHMFRDPALDQALVDQLAPGGLLAAAALSEVGAQPGRFRAAEGELLRAFGHLEVIAHREGQGTAVLVARQH